MNRSSDNVRVDEGGDQREISKSQNHFVSIEQKDIFKSTIRTPFDLLFTFASAFIFIFLRVLGVLPLNSPTSFSDEFSVFLQCMNELNKRSVYEKLVLYYQSGTGNSYRTAVWMAEATQKAGLPVELIPIHLANPVKELTDNAKSLVGFVSPTHGFIAPWSMLKFGRVFIPGLSEIVFAALYFLIYLSAVSAAYLLYFGLSLVPLGNTLLTWTTLTHIYRRYSEPETTLHDLQKSSTPFHRSEGS